MTEENHTPNLGAPADVGTGSMESSDSALGASAAKVVAESDGTKSPVPALASPVLAQPPVVFGGQFQDVEATETVSEGETRNYVDADGLSHVAEVVASHKDGTVDILVAAGVARIRHDNVPWKKDGMAGGFVE